MRLMIVTRFPCEGTVWEFRNPEEVKLWWRKGVTWGKRVSIDGLDPLSIDCCFLARSVTCPSELQRPLLCFCCHDVMGPLNCEPNKRAIPQSALTGHFAAEQGKWLLVGTAYSAHLRQTSATMSSVSVRGTLSTDTDIHGNEWRRQVTPSTVELSSVKVELGSLQGVDTQQVLT